MTTILAITIASLAAIIASYHFYQLHSERQNRRWKPVTHCGPATQLWYDYTKYTPDDPHGEYLVTDGCTFWTASYEDALGQFEPLDWSVKHFTPILPAEQKTILMVPTTSRTPMPR